MPFFGSVQKLGDTCSDELRLMLRLLAILLIVEPELLGAGPIDLIVEFRRIELLLDMDVNETGDVRHSLLQSLGEFLIAGAVGSLHFDVDLRGNAEIQDLRDHVGRLEIEQHVGEVSGQHRCVVS